LISQGNGRGGYQSSAESVVQPLFPVPLNVESWAWVCVVAIGLALRLLLLDRLPLSEDEARFAFPAWQGFQGLLDGSLVDVGAPLLSNALALLFWLFNASDVTARLLPALAGASLPLTPLILRSTIGWRAALIAGVLLAVTPSAVATSCSSQWPFAGQVTQSSGWSEM